MRSLLLFVRLLGSLLLSPSMASKGFLLSPWGPPVFDGDTFFPEGIAKGPARGQREKDKARH